MKLLHRLLLYLLLVAIPVALGGVWLFYSLIQSGIRYEVDEQLRSDLVSVRHQLQVVQRDVSGLNNSRIRISHARQAGPPVLSDTVGIDPLENEWVPIRRLTAIVPVTTRQSRTLYAVVISQPMGEFNEIARLLSVGVTLTFLVLLGLLMLLNGWVVRRLWQPFDRLIEQVRQYRLDTRSQLVPSEMVFPTSTIDEFNQLAAALNAMSRNVQAQFVAQRQFTDNAAHEMQTPLAAAGHELENLMATQPLTTEQLAHIEQAQDSIQRLIRLHKSLLLLTRIENRQFESASISLSPLVAKLVKIYGDFADHHQLRWSATVAPDVFQTIHPYLAEVLFGNLLQNAVRYAEPHTEVTILLTASQFQIQNVGAPLPFPAERLFERFVKNPAFPESTGLGLAIVAEIARLSAIQVRYTYDENRRLHGFLATF